MSATLFASGDPYDEDRDLTKEEYEAVLARTDIQLDLFFDEDAWASVPQ